MESLRRVNTSYLGTWGDTTTTFLDHHSPFAKGRRRLPRHRVVRAPVEMHRDNNGQEASSHRIPRLSPWFSDWPGDRDSNDRGQAGPTTCLLGAETALWDLH